jgi:hypothetical protein
MAIAALEEAENHECPEEAWYLWEHFLTMNARRTGSGYGPNALSNLEVACWAARRGITLSMEENAIIDCFEAAYLRHCAKVNAKVIKGNA